MSDVKRMDILKLIQTILDKNPMQSKILIEKITQKTGLGRSTIFDHLQSLVLREEIFRDRGIYYLPVQWTAHVNALSVKKFDYPNLDYKITQITTDPNFVRELPSVGFNITNKSGYPIRFRVWVRMVLDGKDLGLIQDRKGYYRGDRQWFFDPGKGIVNGNFSVLEDCVKSDKELTLEVRIVAYDPDGKETKLSPKSYTYVRNKNWWFLEPSAFTNG